MMAGTYTVDEAREALQHCDPGTDRAGWVRLMSAAKDAGLTFDDVLTWSASAANFGSERDVLTAWRSIRADGAVKAGTLYHEARAAGWKPRQRDESARPAPRAAAPAARPVEPAKPPRWAAADVWERAEPADAAHPYVIRKNGVPDGLRVVPEGDPVRIAGLPMAGALVVPVWALESGELLSLQFIAAPSQAEEWKAAGRPGKLNLPGHPLRGGAFIVGPQPQAGAQVYIVEGIGQAWACWQATGRAAAVAFGAGNMRSVAAALLERRAGVSPVLVPDAGKEADAQAIAAELGCLAAPMPADSPANFDANDYASKHGAAALAELLERAAAPASEGASEPASRFRLMTPAELLALPARRWRVKGVLPADGLAAVYGPSASGKSFLCIDLAAAIAEGRDWFGYRVKPAPVVYLPLEGEGGIAQRAQAWQAEHGRALPDGLHIVMDPFKLTESADVQALAAVVAQAGLEPVLFVDTLNRAAPEADENASADMGRIIEGAKELQRQTGGLVILVHHTGKDASRGLRGHSSLFAALDAAIEVTRDDDRRAWKASKAKDGRDGDGHPFALSVHELGEDDDGDTVTSCAIKPDDSASTAAPRPKRPQGGNQRIVWDALMPLFKAGTAHGKGGALPTVACIDLEAAVQAGAAAMTCTSDRRTERARDAVRGLVSRGVLCCRDGWLWQT